MLAWPGALEPHRPTRCEESSDIGAAFDTLRLGKRRRSFSASYISTNFDGFRYGSSGKGMETA